MLKASVNHEKVNLKPVDRTEKSKENVPKGDDAKEQKADKKPLGAQTANKGFASGLAANKSSPFSKFLTVCIGLNLNLTFTCVH